MIAIGIIIIPAFARVVRAAVLEVMGFPFIESARALGGGDLRIMFRHVIPNIVAPLIVLTTVYFSTAILAEATLSASSGSARSRPRRRGATCSRRRARYIDPSVWMSIFPGLAIMIVVLGFNFLGDGLRDVLDPRVGGGVGDVVTEDRSTPMLDLLVRDGWSSTAAARRRSAATSRSRTAGSPHVGAGRTAAAPTA